MLTFDPERELAHFSNGDVVEICYIQFSELDCPALEAFLGGLLRSISMEYLLEIVFTVLNELLVNAFKANVKRVYFESIGKDIENKDDYIEGLKNFREEFAEFNEKVHLALTRSNYRIQLKIAHNSDKIQFWIVNNAKMVEDEMERIQFRIKSSSKFKTLSEAYQENLDSYESTGLGIVLTTLLLRNSGIDKNHLSISSSDDSTVAYFEIPKQIIPKEIREKIKKILLEKVEGLPPFPEKIVNLIKVLNDPNSTMMKVASEIEKDPGITVEILKLANSPLFQVQGQISTVSDAIKRIGLRNIEKILYAAGTHRIFPLNSLHVKEIWEHASMTAFFSMHLSHLRRPTARRELASIGGLLHDLGSMVVVTLDRSLIEMINELRSDRNMSHSTFIEEITVGDNHTEIGLYLASKWNFPDELKDIIYHHHRPWLSDNLFKSECETVYLADIMSNLHRKNVNFALIDPLILRSFSIDSFDQMTKIADQLRIKYEAAKSLEN
jgi:putative nucleotidyltransferase with HDIG domain